MAQWTIHTGADFGRAIAEIRSRQQLTQAQLGQQVGLGRDYLAHIEAGRTVTLMEHMLRVLRRSGAVVTVTWLGENGQA